MAGFLGTLASWLASAFGKALAQIVQDYRATLESRRLGRAEATAEGLRSAETAEAKGRAAAAASTASDEDDGFMRDD